MTDFGTKLREAYVAALDGILYGGASVPIVDDKLEITSQVYMRLTTQNMTSANTKSYFAGECDVLIQVISTQKSAVAKSIVEAICTDIMNILFPSVATNGLSIGGSYKISYAKLTNSTNTTAIQVADGIEISKTLTIKNRVIQ